MPTPSVLILRAPGTNCDQETAFAFEKAGAKTQTLHLNRVLENPAVTQNHQILCIPGGFSFGDDIAAGRIFGNQVRRHLAEAMQSFRDSDKLILGICNGFQVLTNTGLLFDDPAESPAGEPPAALTDNVGGKYECRWVRLAANGSRCVFLKGMESLELPVAHAEGNLVFRSADLCRRFLDSGRLPLRYLGSTEGSASPDLGPSVCYPENPNGSMADAAGMCDSTGRVFGLMPHPERHIDPTHHPRWTRRTVQPLHGDGFALFQNAVGYFG